MVDGKFVRWAALPSWRDRSGKAVTGNDYVEGGKSRNMTAAELEDIKKKRGRPGTSVLAESDTLGGER